MQLVLRGMLWGEWRNPRKAARLNGGGLVVADVRVEKLELEENATVTDEHKAEDQQETQRNYVQKDWLGPEDQR